MRKWVLWLCLMLAAGPAMAADTLPDFLHPYLNAEAPRGHATFRRLFFKIYTANLWSDADDIDYKNTFALSITYDVNANSGELVDSTVEQMAHVMGKRAKDYDHLRRDMAKVLPMVKPGDTITALFVPGEAVRFFFNGKPTGQIGEKGFAEAFFGIWISENTPEPSFRAALLE